MSTASGASTALAAVSTMSVVDRTPAPQRLHRISRKAPPKLDLKDLEAAEAEQRRVMGTTEQSINSSHLVARSTSPVIPVVPTNPTTSAIRTVCTIPTIFDAFGAPVECLDLPSWIARMTEAQIAALPTIPTLPTLRTVAGIPTIPNAPTLSTVSIVPTIFDAFNVAPECLDLPSWMEKTLKSQVPSNLRVLTIPSKSVAPILKGPGRLRQMVTVKEDGKPDVDYIFGNKIGRGQFGVVYRALNIDTGETAAIKQIQLDGLGEEEIDRLMKEVDILRRLDHPAIVKYSGVVRNRDTLNIILEYAENGSLGSTIRTFGKLSEKLVASNVMRILEGLHYLHDQKVVHCDLKAANILTTKTGNIKLTDFGVSLSLTAVEKTRRNEMAGTPNWMAREVINLEGASPASDIWSLGCTIIELLTGRPPFPAIKTSMGVLRHIAAGGLPEIPSDCSHSLQAFLSQCFERDPIMRPSAEVLFEHAWLQENAEYPKSYQKDSIPYLRRLSLEGLDDLRQAGSVSCMLSDECLPALSSLLPASPPRRGSPGRRLIHWVRSRSQALSVLSSRRSARSSLELARSSASFIRSFEQELEVASSSVAESSYNPSEIRTKDRQNQHGGTDLTACPRSSCFGAPGSFVFNETALSKEFGRDSC
ncbi:pkinase-domain-containing protein [Phaffia rhodozyma]|uniref:Pkinase-domain-containing protein n=1 Tax=Phaffia rhodozyma TaxID=264483 RepID=A0A0F7SMW8_PHARH|nr:pkinase-domain-containing protein [Phaffia rhodozyma]